ncbi:ABC transporter permease subunit [Pseudactinotalea sp. HY158]|nr:ABC transporter permease subunit [Pseudactinotalea sp. HY158]
MDRSVVTDNIRTSAAEAPVVPRRRSRRDFSFDSISFFLVFLGVPLAVFLFLVIWPFIQAAYYSLTDWNGLTASMNFIGLDNFERLLNDDLFMKALGNSVLLLAVVPTLILIIALTFATLITVGGASKGQIRGLKGSSFYRVVSFFPYTIPGVAIGLLWQLVLLPNGGLVNSLLVELGFDGFAGFAWLGDKTTAMPVSIFVIMWGLIGFYMLLFIAAIKDVPAETYEAARLDGAGRFRTAISITIPLIRENVQTAWIYLGIFALDAFAYMSVLNSTGGPEYSTLVITQYLYRVAFNDFKFGYASAIGVFLAVITLLFAALVFSVNYLTGGGNRKAKR